MLRQLAEHGVCVLWDELPGKEHWWWDTEARPYTPYCL
jgi:hypothetical protein